MRFKLELRKRRIDTPTELTVNHQENGEIKATMCLGKNKTHLLKAASEITQQKEIYELIRRPLQPRYMSWKNVIYFDYPVHSETNQFFRSYLKSPVQMVLSQMRGILISSIFLLVLIILAFVYFRTWLAWWNKSLPWP